MSGWRRQAGSPPHVIGHRGARQDAPENTLEAFRLAIEQGAAGIELDVRLDGSGQVIVLHDRTLGRVTDERDRRDVEHLHSAELARVTLAGGARVPTLAEVLAWASAAGHLVNVEVKRDVTRRATLVSRVARLVRDTEGAEHTVLLSSFDPLIVRALAFLVPDVPVAWLVHAKQRWLRRAPGYRWLGAAGVHPELACAEPERVRALRAAGALVDVWTVNDAAAARELAAWGVDAIISDVPGRIVAALAAR